MIYDARIIPCAYCQWLVILSIFYRQSFIHAEGGQIADRDVNAAEVTRGSSGSSLESLETIMIKGTARNNFFLSQSFQINKF